MPDDTRDIAIETRSDVRQLRKAVDDLQDAMTELKDDLQQRKGMEKVVRGVYAFLGGAGGSGLIIAVSKLTGIPLPR